MRRLAQGHLDTQLEGAGDRTGKRQVTSQPAPPPELLSPHRYIDIHHTERRPVFRPVERRINPEERIPYMCGNE